MTRKLMVGAAIGALMVSGALAQAPPAPSSPSSTPPTATSPTPPPAPQAQPKADSQVQPKADFVMSQKPDQWLASRFKGTDVVGADNKKIGDVTDILFDKTGKIEAYVISVGGFLGMGAKDVALAPSSFDVFKGENGSADRLTISLSKDELQQAQNFTPYAPPRVTTGAGPGGTRPSGAGSGLGGGSTGMRPTTNYMPPSGSPPTGK